MTLDINNKTDLPPPKLTVAMARKISWLLWMKHMEYRPPCRIQQSPSDRYCELFGYMRKK